MKPNSIAGLVSTLDKYYGNMHEQMQEADDLYHQRLERFLPQTDYDIRVHKTSTARNIVDGFKNQIRTDEPTVQYLMAGTGKANDSLRSRLEQWGRYMLRQERLNSPIDPNLQVAFDALLRGAGCKKIMLDVSKIPGPKPKGKKAQLEWETKLLKDWPFISRALDPRTVYPSPGMARPHRYVVEKQKRTVDDMSADIINGRWVDSSGENDPAREVIRYEYWSQPEYNDDGEQVEPGHYMVEVEGQLVEDKDNPYGFVCYIFEYSGMGRMDEDGDPEHLAISVLTGIAGELAKEVETLTAISAMASSHAFPTILTPEDAKKVARQFSGGGAGKVIHFDPIMGRPEYMSPPPPNNNFFLYLDRIDANIKRVASPALSGQKEQGVQYGVLQAQLTGQQLTYIRPLRAMVNRVGTQSLMMMAALMRRFDFDMLIDGSAEEDKNRTITPDDFKHGTWEVEFETVDPAENDRMLLVGEAIRRAGDLSQRTFWEVYAKHIVKNPDEEEARLGAEKLFNMWVESGQWLQTVIQEDGQADQEAAMGAQAGQMEQQVQSFLAEQSNGRARQQEGMAGIPNNQAAAGESADAGQAAAFGGF
jgi:hypothetical protein